MVPERTTYCWQRRSMSCFLDFFAPHATEVWETTVPGCGLGPAKTTAALSIRAAKKDKDFFILAPGPEETSLRTSLSIAQIDSANFKTAGRVGSQKRRIGKVNDIAVIPTGRDWDV